jgi:2-keto-4-pentenoate hydratase
MSTEPSADAWELETGIASEFVAARRKGVGLPRYPGPRPASLAAAYRIQDHALALDGRTVAGWKVGRIAEPDATTLGARRLAGPIFSDCIVAQVPGAVAQMNAFSDGFIAVEAEFMMRLRVPADCANAARQPSARDWVDTVRIGIEIASSPYPGINDDGPCVTASDFGNNHGVLLGAEVAGWRTRDSQPIKVVTEIEDRAVGKATIDGSLGGPFEAVSFLLEHLAKRGIAPQSGWWVSSGALTGVHVARVGDSAVAKFSEIGSVTCRLVAAESR